MNRQEAIANLRNCLASLYPDNASAERVAYDAQLNATLVNFSGSPINRWQAILLEADKENKIEDVFSVALKEYGKNTVLRTACDLYRDVASPSDWNPPKIDVTVARHVAIELETRRILFSPPESEYIYVKNTVTSVRWIRNYLGKQLKTLDSESPLAKHLREMRNACVKFLDEVRLTKGKFPLGEVPYVHAVTKMRNVFGTHLAQIAGLYHIKIEEPLSSILPVGDDSSTSA